MTTTLTTSITIHCETTAPAGWNGYLTKWGYDGFHLRTEWATGNVTHQRDARESDRLSSTGAMWQEVADHLNSKGIT